MSASLEADPALDTGAGPVDAPAAGGTPLVIKLLVAATFVVILNETIMMNAVPRLMTDFGIDERTSQWISSIFMLTMAAVIPVTGWFLQRVTTRSAYAVAMVTFSLGTLLGAVAPTFEILLAARVIQAGGTAVMMPLLMTTLMTVVAESDRGRVMGQVTMAISVAPALGPAVSGVLLQFGSWRLIFEVVLVVAVLVGVAGHRQIPNVGEPTKGPVSVVSVLLAAAGFSTLVYGLTQFGQGSWITPLTLSLVGFGLVAAFVVYQVVLQRTGTPLLDLRTLSHRTFAVAVLLMAAAFMAFLGSMVLLPIYLQNLRGLSSLETGLLVMPGGLAMGLLGPRVGRLYDRFGSRPLVIPGALGMVVALALLSRVGVETPYWAILVVHVGLMAALATIFTPVFTIGLGALPQHLYSHGSSLLGTTQQVAGAVGMALLVVIMKARSTHLDDAGVSKSESFVGGLQWAFAAGAVMGLAVLACALFLPSKVASPEGAPAGH